MKRLVGLCSVVVFSGLVSFAIGASEARASDVIIKVKPARMSALRAMHSLMGAQVTEPSRLIPELQAVTLPKDVSLPAALELYRKSDAVEYAEPNFKVRAFTAPYSSNDPLFGEQWALQNGGQNGGIAGVDVDALKAWSIAKNDHEVVVAVIDTGVDYTHADIAPNIWTNPGEIPGDGKDNDGNGFVDDIHGWDFANKDSDPKDDHSHGTHCAGIIAASHDGQGMMGVAPHARIMAVKFLNAGGGGTIEDAIRATEYAILNKADILSNSWGGDDHSKALEEVIEVANQRGILYVAAAGNDHSNNDSSPTYPASSKSPNVISVAAIDNRDEQARFTNWGATSVHLAAPGVAIFSSVLKSKYKPLSGTSMACPHVAGAAALLKAHTGMSHLELKKRLIESVHKTTQLKELVVSGGRLNLYNALAGIESPAAPPEMGWTRVAYDLRSPHDYPPLADLKWTISQPGAKSIRVHFSRVVTQKRVDYVGLIDADGKMIETLTGDQGSLWSREIPGDQVVITLRSDSEKEFFGFEIDGFKYR